jgi:putative membrane protein
MKSRIAMGATIVALGVAALGAQQSPAAPQTPDAPASRPTQANHLFVVEAAIGGRAEVDLGQLAAERASDPRVREFAQRMVQDHGAAGSELTELASRKNIALPRSLDPKHRMLHTRLARLSGDAFDRAYVREMLADHRKDVSEFRKQSQSSSDPDIKAWAARTLPTLEQHLSMIEEISRAQVGTSGGTSPKPTSDGSRTR